MGTDLLEVGGEAVHVLVVRQHSVSLSVEEIDVPDAQQSQQDGSIPVQGSSTEVFVLPQRKKLVFFFFFIRHFQFTVRDLIYLRGGSVSLILVYVPSSELLTEASQSCQSLMRRYKENTVSPSGYEITIPTYLLKPVLAYIFICERSIHPALQSN